MLPRLYYITPNTDCLRKAEEACKNGVRLVQLRMKNYPMDDVRKKAIAMKKMCHAYGAIFIINDFVNLANEISADGVHVGSKDMCVQDARALLGDDKIIGATANTIDEVVEHWTNGVDYIGLGPYKFTTTKRKLAPILDQNMNAILDIAKNKGVTCPIYAIGGIQKQDIAPIFRTGVYGIAASTMLSDWSDPELQMSLKGLINNVGNNWERIN